MLGRVASLGLVTSVLFGCSKPEEPKPEPEPAAKAPEPEESPAASSLPKAPSMAGAAAVPKVEVLVPRARCPKLPKLADDAPESQRALSSSVAVLRAISCQPQMFGLSLEDVVQTLPVPDAVDFELGRGYAAVNLGGSVSLSDLLAVLGVEGAKMRLERDWTSRWTVGTGDDAAPLEPWPPGVVRIQMAAHRDDPRESGTIADIPEGATVEGAVSVAMPRDVIAFGDDPHAAAALVSALIGLAGDPQLLEKQPKAVRKKLTTLGERYTLAPYSEGSGDEQRRGFTLRPNRTELLASQLAEGLGLEQPAHVAISITDTNPNRLADGERTEIVWHGLQLEIELDERSAEEEGLASWVVSDLQVLPAPAG